MNNNPRRPWATMKLENSLSLQLGTALASDLTGTFRSMANDPLIEYFTEEDVRAEVRRVIRLRVGNVRHIERLVDSALDLAWESVEAYWDRKEKAAAR